MQLSRSVVGRSGMAQRGPVAAIGRGARRLWHRQLYVRMASTAIIFSTLQQPLRPALHLPCVVIKQQVGPAGGRVSRGAGNCSSLLLLRQCAAAASTDVSPGAPVASVLLETRAAAAAAAASTEVSPGAPGASVLSETRAAAAAASTDASAGAPEASVLLGTRECADGSIMYKFGSPDPKQAVSTVVGPNSGEGGGGLGKSEVELTTETPAADVGHSPELSGEPDVEPVVVVNGVQHQTPSSSPSAAAAKEQESDLDGPVTDVDQKLRSLELGGPPSDSASVNGIPASAQAPAQDIDSPGSPDVGGEVNKDKTSNEKSPACFTSGAAMIPHPEKAARGGEDAFFIEGTRWIGVADGVGGWANDGINAGLYARELMWNCVEMVRESHKDSDAKTVLVKSFSKTKALGSTTAVVASISNQTLNVVNIGDTGFLVIRNGVVVDRSRPMLRGFNFPYQIGSQGDDPLLAEVYNVPVQKGDVIVLATDGVFDNLFEYEIVDIVKADVQSGSGPEVVAQKLADYAHKTGATEVGLTPFAREAYRAGYNYAGGKMDDITVVVSFVS